MTLLEYLHMESNVCTSLSLQTDACSSLIWGINQYVFIYRRLISLILRCVCQHTVKDRMQTNWYWYLLDSYDDIVWWTENRKFYSFWWQKDGNPQQQMEIIMLLPHCFTSTQQTLRAKFTMNLQAFLGTVRDQVGRREDTGKSIGKLGFILLEKKQVTINKKL